MKPFAIVMAAALVWITAAAGCGKKPGSNAEPAPQGTLPELTGARIGPQPGPDRAFPEIDNPYGMGPNVLTEGRQMFVWFNCYGCHGGRGGGGMGPSLRDATWLYGKSHQDVFNSIAEGRPHGMPAWGTKLPAQQIWKMVSYIKSMDTPSEPEPPPKNPSFPDPPPRRDIKGVEAGGSR